MWSTIPGMTKVMTHGMRESKTSKKWYDEDEPKDDKKTEIKHLIRFGRQDKEPTLDNTNPL